MEMHREENFASVADALARQSRFGTPPLTPLLAPLRSPSEKQFLIIYKVAVTLDKESYDKEWYDKEHPTWSPPFEYYFTD